MRGVFNWNFADVVRFLKGRNFILGHTEGSHYFYIGTIEGKKRQACVPFHGTKAFKPQTLKSIIVQSGIPQKEWLEK